MIRFENYVRPETFDEAYELNQSMKNIVGGGMMWTHLSDAKYDSFIDLSDLLSDQIKEEDEYFKIGAMTSLYDLETYEPFKEHFNTAFEDCLKHIVGVQFRNLATIGGSICARLGFSDIITLLLPLECKLIFHSQGEIALQDFLKNKNQRDILKYILIPKKKMKIAFESVRITYTDLPVINVCGIQKEDNYYFAVGARPNIAVLVKEDEAVTFGSNQRGSRQYREKLYGVLKKRIKDALEEN